VLCVCVRPPAWYAAGADFILGSVCFELRICKGGLIPSWTKELLPLLEDELFRTVSQLGLLCSTDYKQVWDCMQQNSH